MKYVQPTLKPSKAGQTGAGLWLWPVLISIFLMTLNFAGYFFIVSAEIGLSQKLVGMLILSGCVVLVAAIFCVLFFVTGAINDIGAIAIIVLAVALVLIDLTLRFVLAEKFGGGGP